MLPVPHPIQLLCPNQGLNLLGMGWKLCSYACVCHILLYPFLAVVDGFVYIFALAVCPCCYTIVHFH